MKRIRQFVASLIIISLILSCNKNGADPVECSTEPRKVKFSLYTSKNFSGMGENVVFTLSIKENGRLIWDSLLPPIKLRDIPGFSNRIVVEKEIPLDSHKPLRAGFVYAIENIGMSWFIDDVEPCIWHKNISFDFQ